MKLTPIFYFVRNFHNVYAYLYAGHSIEEAFKAYDDGKEEDLKYISREAFESSLRTIYNHLFKYYGEPAKLSSKNAEWVNINELSKNIAEFANSHQFTDDDNILRFNDDTSFSTFITKATLALIKENSVEEEDEEEETGEQNPLFQNPQNSPLYQDIDSIIKERDYLRIQLEALGKDIEAQKMHLQQKDEYIAMLEKELSDHGINI